MNKKKLLLLLLIIVLLATIGLYGSYAMIEGNILGTNGDIYDYEFIIGSTSNREIILNSSQTKTIDIKISNPLDGTLNYGLAYSTDNFEDIKIGTLNTSTDNAVSSIEKEDTKLVSVIIKNLTNNEIKIDISLITGYINGGELLLEKNQKMITDVIDINNLLDTNLDESGANAPNLVDGMIPVYYDDEDSNWHIADSSNTNLDYEWYDYNNKRWANVVLVNKLDKYKKETKGDIVNDEDILAFFVWIPRFKYKVWSMNKEGESTYNAIESGIGIVFEKETSSTGEISCNNNECSGNSSEYYTHPAFKIGDRELTGFWVGKFETTGTEELPTILPSQNALTNMTLIDQFNTTKKIKTDRNYNIAGDNNLDSHLVKDYEWNAISYLTNSKYGICNGTRNGCRNIYRNNSTYYYTGVTAGDYSVSSNYGTYSYKGELLNEYGTPDEFITGEYFGSTTGNIYGIYDMVGGAYESIMATNYEDNELLKNIDKKYYDIINNGLGTTNVIQETDLEPGNFIVKGGSSEDININIFSTSYYSGKVEPNVGFRIILS